MKMTRLLGLAVAVLALVAVAQPAQAACSAPFLISTINSNTGYYAYVINPSVTPGGGGDGYMGSSIGGSFTGFFWGVGVGNPIPGVGADNGSFPALSWMYIYPNYPASVLTTWAADLSIDTCIDVMGPLGQRCQVTFMQDADTATGAGMFAITTVPDDPASGDYFLDNGGVNLTLAPMPQAVITGSTATGGRTGVDVNITGPAAGDLTAGAYLSAAATCQGAGGGGGDPLNGLVTGFKSYYTVLAEGSMPPTDFSRALWTDSGLGTAALGTAQTVSVDCSGGDSDVYIAYSLVLDSGFEANLLSSSSTRVECGPTVADPDNIRVKPEGRQAPRTRQR